MKDKIRFVFSELIATAGGAGYAPVAPGTFGSVVGVALVWLCLSWKIEHKFLLGLTLLFVGSWAGAEVNSRSGKADSNKIVIDEVLGMLISTATISNGPNLSLNLLVAFSLFRFFDILKPPPCRQIDSWCKSLTPGTFQNGFGVMADDLAAGIQALIVYEILFYLKVLV